MAAQSRRSTRQIQLRDLGKFNDLDRKVVWHPYTQMRDYAKSDPIIIERGEGPYLYDIRRRRFLDAFGSMWCNVWGHCYPELVQVMQEQAARLNHASLFTTSHLPAVEFAGMLVDAIKEDFRFAEVPPTLGHVFYSDNGSTAVEVALKMALQYHNQAGDIKRTQFLSFHLGYHGDTFGAMSVSRIDTFRQKFAPQLFDGYDADYLMQVDPVERPANFRATEKNLESLMAGRSDRLAAVVIEPVIQAAAGMRPLAEDYLGRIKKYCRTYDILLITDEVFTGFCRTGPLIASSAELVEPDIICLGKGITGGALPMAVTVANDKVYNAFDAEWKDMYHLLHGHTYSGNPMACAVAIRSLQLIEEKKLKENVKARAREFRVGFRSRLASHPRVGELRQRGLAMGIPILDENGEDKGGYEARDDANRVCAKVLEQRVILRPLGNVITIVPPLNIGSEHVDEIIGALEIGLKVLDEDKSA